MIPIGRINSPQAAQVFCDYLSSQKIVADWLPEGAMYVIRVQGKQSATEARLALQHFLQQPHDSRYQRATWSHGQPQETSSAAPAAAWQPQLLTRVGPMTKGLMLLAAMISLLCLF